MTILCVAPRYNTDKPDATGAFQPEARAFAALHGAAAPVLYDNRATKPARRRAVLGAIAAVHPDVLAIFGHGWETGIQCGFGLAQVGDLAGALAGAARAPRVILYGCLTAEGTGPGGDGGFADALRDALCAAGAAWAQVDAHVTAGHCCRNPYVRRFEGAGVPTGGLGGAYLVTPGAALWKPWVAALKGDLRFRFPFLSAVAIHCELGGAA